MKTIPGNDIAKLRGLEKILHYTFRDISYLHQALVHKSYVNEVPELEIQDNERYEFLGDAVLEFIVTDYLFSKYPAEAEGSLTERRSCIVDRDNCAKLAKTFKLDRFIFLGKGESAAGKPIKISIMANALEAVVAAIYLDGGMAECSKFVIAAIEKHGSKAGQRICRNFKAELQKYVQKEYHKVPLYRDVSAEGPDHEKIFEVSVWIDDELYGKGRGSNKKTAQQQAAHKALRKILSKIENTSFSGESVEK